MCRRQRILQPRPLSGSFLYFCLYLAGETRGTGQIGRKRRRKKKKDVSRKKSERNLVLFREREERWMLREERLLFLLLFVPGEFVYLIENLGRRRFVAKRQSFPFCRKRIEEGSDEPIASEVLLREIVIQPEKQPSGHHRVRCTYTEDQNVREGPLLHPTAHRARSSKTP